MNPKKRQPYPGAQKLKELKEQGLSNVKIAHLHGVSSQTIHRWMVKAGLEGELPSDEPDAERFSKLVKAPAEQEVIEGEVLDPEIDAQNAQLAPVGASQPTTPIHADQDDDESAFSRLSQTQKRAVALLAERPALQGKELAQELGVTESTVSLWKQSPLFQEAIREMLIPAFRTESLLMVMADLKRVIQSGKARPEDRKLLAELSGLTQGDQINVNVAVDSSGWFGKRWKQ